MATVKDLKATARPKAGKGAARAERRAGRVPGVIYGDNKPPLSISLDHNEIRQRIYAGHFLTTLHDLEIDGAKHPDVEAEQGAAPAGDLAILENRRGTQILDSDNLVEHRRAAIARLTSGEQRGRVVGKPGAGGIHRATQRPGEPHRQDEVADHRRRREPDRDLGDARHGDEERK